MRIRHLISDVRHALRLSKVSCELSDTDLEAMLLHAVEDVGDRRRTSCIVECTLARARHACEELIAEREAAGRAPRKRTRRRAKSRRSR